VRQTGLGRKILLVCSIALLLALVAWLIGPRYSSLQALEYIRHTQEELAGGESVQATAFLKRAQKLGITTDEINDVIWLYFKDCSESPLAPKGVLCEARVVQGVVESLRCSERGLL